MAERKKQGIWRNFIYLIRQIKLPAALIGAAFLLNLGKALIELTIPEKIAGLTEMDLSLGDGTIVKAAAAVCFTIFALALVEFIGGLAATYITYIAKARINRDFQTVGARKIFSLTIADAEARDPKEFISRITTDTGFVSDFLIDLLVMEVPRLYFLISSMIRVSGMGNGSMVLSFILIIPVIILGSFWSGRVTYRTQSRLQNSIAYLTAKLAEKLGHAETIKAYNKTEDEISDGDIYIDQMKAAQKKTALAAAFNQWISNILFIVPVLIIMVTGVLQLLSGSVTTAQFIVYFSLGTTYQKYIAEHLTLWVLAKKAQGATLRISEILELEEDEGGATKADQSGELRFDHVSFSIGEKSILSDLDFTIESGSKFAIVGASGSGKSTLLHLIEQFYRPEDGHIFMDGTDIRDFEISSYRNLFSCLPQNAPGFSGTVRDFLTYGSKNPCPDEVLYDMLRKVDMAESIAALGGLDYEVGPGASRLSGGQRQRLAVVRMLLSDARIVLADEATSALDVQGTKKIAALIDEYAQGKTRILVAHDLSAVQDADQILVLDKGSAVGLGTDAELRKECGIYRSLLGAGKEELA